MYSSSSGISPLILPTRGVRFVVLTSGGGDLEPVISSGGDYIDLVGPIVEAVQMASFDPEARTAARRIDAVALTKNNVSSVELLISSVILRRRPTVWYF